MAEAGEPVVYEVGLEPNERTMRSAIGLVWRLVIAWMAFIANADHRSLAWLIPESVYRLFLSRNVIV